MWLDLCLPVRRTLSGLENNAWGKEETGSLGRDMSPALPRSGRGQTCPMPPTCGTEPCPRGGWGAPCPALPYGLGAAKLLEESFCLLRRAQAGRMRRETDIFSAAFGLRCNHHSSHIYYTPSDPMPLCPAPSPGPHT